MFTLTSIAAVIGGLGVAAPALALLTRLKPFRRLILIGAAVLLLLGAVLWALAWHAGRVSDLKAEHELIGETRERVKWQTEKAALKASLDAARRDAESAQTVLELRLITEEDRLNAEREANQQDLAGALSGAGGDSVIPERLLRSFRRASGQVGGDSD